ncbi:hypothetical protein HPB50_026623 [Hyalomma asiaticum]|uniref:Uncharacterized protein n=1 Tax=Hyalomma asiaticum TaxID=266040 RepID=A0ACB7RWR0_HYAAI|nr:hypothetical protein HPB50_026623 [Hyalomma asiaticum]
MVPAPTDAGSGDSTTITSPIVQAIVRQNNGFLHRDRAVWRTTDNRTGRYRPRYCNTRSFSPPRASYAPYYRQDGYRCAPPAQLSNPDTFRSLNSHSTSRRGRASSNAAVRQGPAAPLSPRRAGIAALTKKAFFSPNYERQCEVTGTPVVAEETNRDSGWITVTRKRSKVKKAGEDFGARTTAFMPTARAPTRGRRDFKDGKKKAL